MIGSLQIEAAAKQEHGCASIALAFRQCEFVRESSVQQIRSLIDAALQQKDWPALFGLFQSLPLKYGLPLLARLRASGWRPEQEESLPFFRAVLEEKADALTSTSLETSAIFDRWLYEGCVGERSLLEEAELLQRLDQAAPPEGVRIVAALSMKAKAGGAAAHKVQSHEHWLVRLAGWKTGLCSVTQKDFAESCNDGNFWIKRLVNITPILDFWPVEMEPADLERLTEDFQRIGYGPLDARVRVFALLLAQYITACEVGEVEEARDDAGEFTEA